MVKALYEERVDNRDLGIGSVHAVVRGREKVIVTPSGVSLQLTKVFVSTFFAPLSSEGRTSEDCSWEAKKCSALQKIHEDEDDSRPVNCGFLHNYSGVGTTPALLM